MDITFTHIKNLYILENPKFEDERGCFHKPFNIELFQEKGLDVNFCEFYYSVSKKNVVRGMHFQTPPHEHTKLVYVSKGKILDVILDLRKKSDTFGQYFSTELSEEEGKYLYIPKGCAHGFLSLEDDTIVNYAQTTSYSKECDSGILYNSFGFDWNVDVEIMSGRDKLFPKLSEFKSPF